jgi:hypothetical protein
MMAAATSLDTLVGTEDGPTVVLSKAQPIKYPARPYRTSSDFERAVSEERLMYASTTLPNGQTTRQEMETHPLEATRTRLAMLDRSFSAFPTIAPATYTPAISHSSDGFLL